MTPQQKPEQEKAPPRVSVVVVSYNRVGPLRKCLQSIENSQLREALQVILVDNGSSDGSAQLDSEFPHVQFIRLPKNFGLTKALNLGWRAADAPYVFFLHDDTEIAPDAISLLADVLDANADVAATCPLLVNEEDRPAPQLGNLPPDNHWQPASVSDGEPVPVRYPRGAAFMMRVSLIKAIRQIDEHYGQFGGDADLAAQILRSSKKILLVPAARVRHHGSPAYNDFEEADFLLARSVFIGKYQGFAAGLRARLASIFGPLFRFRFGVLKFTIGGQKIDGSQT